MSEYLRVMRARFNQRNDPSTDPVPWRLDDKQAAYEWVESHGFRTPRRVRTDSPAEALEAGQLFDGRFVVKQPNRHSSMGIYVLEELAPDRYLELFTLTEIGADKVQPKGPAPDYWLTEELLASTVAGRPVPLDYKIFCFRGQITHVIQIDRNISPPRVAVFDGAFIPLVPGTDYTTNAERWELCQPVLPTHAGMMLHMAARLSERLQTAFVRVDCFDTPDGPVFGEFTFASGPDDVGMIRYSDRILAQLDRAIAGAQVEALSGFDIDLASFTKAASGATFNADQRVLSQLAAGGLQGDHRYAANMLSHLTRDSTRAVFAISLGVIGLLNGDRSRAFGVQSLLRTGARHVFGNARLHEFESAAITFHDSRSEGNPWHSARAAEVRLARGEQGARDTLEALADAGFGHARRVLDAHDG